MSAPIDIRKVSPSEELSLSFSPPNRFGWRSRSGSSNSLESSNSDPSNRKSGCRSGSVRSFCSELEARLEALGDDSELNHNVSIERKEESSKIIRRVSVIQEGEESAIKEEEIEITRTTTKIRSFSLREEGSSPISQRKAVAPSSSQNLEAPSFPFLAPRREEAARTFPQRRHSEGGDSLQLIKN